MHIIIYLISFISAGTPDAPPPPAGEGKTQLTEDKSYYYVYINIGISYFPTQSGWLCSHIWAHLQCNQQYYG